MCSSLWRSIFNDLSWGELMRTTTNPLSVSTSQEVLVSPPGKLSTTCGRLLRPGCQLRQLSIATSSRCETVLFMLFPAEITKNDNNHIGDKKKRGEVQAAINVEKD